MTTTTRTTTQPPATSRRINVWRALAIIAFLVNFVPNLIPGQTVLQDPVHGHTPFSVAHIFFVVWWVALYILQVHYVFQLFSKNEQVRRVAFGVVPHFVTFALLEYGWSSLWLRRQWVLAEIVAAVNLLQITWAYFFHQTFGQSLRLYLSVHAAVVAFPFAYLFHIVLWNGAMAVRAHNLIGRLFANVFVSHALICH